MANVKALPSISVPAKVPDAAVSSLVPIDRAPAIGATLSRFATEVKS